MEKIKINTTNIGSTLSVSKIFSDCIVNYWVGDSTIKIYKNSEVLWKSKDHDYNNKEQITEL